MKIAKTKPRKYRYSVPKICLKTVYAHIAELHKILPVDSKKWQEFRDRMIYGAAS
jgi:hypothetical protein